ncbi:hypothetical protein IU449_09280 [Nocardia higoensis]|uniref:Uncharacterized protein n=1 Tax=Nocardia higoensis TaxID=228599 RepID=A0ABS0DDE9_9NOCA|nr:hypothetical protein [Nocardia higoensis]MBF6354733.1 hypothetical protein [Nocardia higoensis]
MTHDDLPSFSHLATQEQNQTVSVAAVPRPVFSSPDTAGAAPVEHIDPRAHGRARGAASQRRH